MNTFFHKSVYASALLNLLAYLLTALLLYYLYAPQNPHPLNQSGSSVQFIYQQF